MLKLLIIDDEEIICQAIANIIDWKSYHIQLLGTCTDGVEAYHMILDECPDIVITDIRMPGISGLELIERINRTDLCTQFVILSGYGEFEYAKRAMKCGVQHYLLKPCTEEQIIECIREVSNDYYEAAHTGKMLLSRQNPSALRLHKTLIRNMIREGLSCPQLSDSFFELYEHYIDLSSTPYHLCHIYYLEESNLPMCLDLFSGFCKKDTDELQIHMIYVRNTLLVFFPDYGMPFAGIDTFFKGLHFAQQTVSVEYDRSLYPDLKTLLVLLIQKLKRYDMLYFIDGTVSIPNFNYKNIVDQINQLLPDIADADQEKHCAAADKLEKILLTVSNKDFLLQLSDNIIISLEAQMTTYTLPEITDILHQLHKEDTVEHILSFMLEYIGKILELHDFQEKQYSPPVAQLIDYIHEHYDDPDLTLKWISENYLYMNVNYVGRCFTKETDEKFSSFLMKLRVQKAKEILSEKNNEQIQNVAELVGCGNTPYYFSKIFKKCTGLTPSAYVRKMSRI